jgi:hypothetical protein
MNRHQLELVTAYLDGEATPEERAAVESDPQLAAEVERMRAVRSALQETGDPAAHARERAIAAALAVFDEEHGIAAVAPPAERDAPLTEIMPLARRRQLRWQQRLGAAAAAALVVVGGAIVASRVSTDGDGGTADEQRTPSAASGGGEAISAPQEPTASPATTIGPEVMMATGVGPGSTAEAVIESSDVMAEADVASDDAGEVELEMESGVAESHADDVAGAAGPTSVPSVAAAPAPPAGLPVIATEADLRELIDGMKEPPVEIDDAASSCVRGLLKTEAHFEDIDGTRRWAVVVTIRPGLIGLLVLDECEVVLETHSR